MSVAVAIGEVEARRLAMNPAIWVSVVPALPWAVYAGDDALGEHFLLSGYGLASSWFVSMVIVALATRRTAASGPIGDCHSATGECVLPLAGFDTVTPWWHVGYLVCVAGLLFAIATASRTTDRRHAIIASSWLAGIVLFSAVQLAVYQRFDGAPR